MLNSINLMMLLLPRGEADSGMAAYREIKRINGSELAQSDKITSIADALTGLSADTAQIILSAFDLPDKEMAVILITIGIESEKVNEIIDNIKQMKEKVF